MKIEVLDHGYVMLIESYGSDERVIEAARMSTNKGFRKWGPLFECPKCSRLFDAAGVAPGETIECLCKHRTVINPKPGDEKLLRYLYENKHHTPFEMAGAIIEVQAPIFVFREWHRHRTQSYNEMSSRYTPLPDLNYVPTVERLLMNASKTKQAGTLEGVSPISDVSLAEQYRESLQTVYEAQQNFYEAALQTGVPKELARIHLPVGRYSKMRAHANLRNWLHFLTLRMAGNAQHEIRQYAHAVHCILSARFPRTLALFDGEL